MKRKTFIKTSAVESTESRRQIDFVSTQSKVMWGFINGVTEMAKPTHEELLRGICLDINEGEVLADIIC